MDEEIRPEGPSPLSVDLIRTLIFSHLEDVDLLNARLVAKDWTPLATQECRGRGKIFPWICRHGEKVCLDEESAGSFMDVMTPSLPLIPVQQVGLLLDLLSIEPSTLLRLLTFIAPWVKALRLVPLASASDIDVKYPLMREEGRKVMSWSCALNSLPPLDFPRLETLDLSEEEECEPLHQSIAIFLIHLMTKVVQGAQCLKRLSYTAFFGNGEYDEMGDMDREATKGILSALPSSLQSLSIGSNCTVDYGALTTLGLNLGEFVWEGFEPEPPQAFLQFLEEQKMGLKRLHLPNLDDVYDSHFPNFPLLTELRMTPRRCSSFKCLTAFPALLTLQVGMEWCPHDPSEITLLLPHQGVRKLVIPHWKWSRPMVRLSYTLFAHALPNLSQLDFTCVDLRDLTPLFTHFSRLTSLKMTVSFTGDLQGLQSILSGLHPSVSEMSEDFAMSDAEAFAAIEVIGSRRGNSTVGMGNLKDLQVLDMSFESPDGICTVFLNKLTFGTVFKKMRSLNEIRIGACEPVLETLRSKGIHVRMYKAKE